MIKRATILAEAGRPPAPTYTDIAIQYCEDVLADKVIACKQVKQACQRHLTDLDKVDTPEYPYTYSIEQAEKVCRFVSKLVHVAGRWAILKDSRFHLQPWQVFFLTSVFGWIHKDTKYRRYREALLSVPRKNGKSFLASAICLYMLVADNEPGAQIFCAANNLEQALTVYRPAKLIVDQLPNLRNAFDIEANVKSLVLPDGSRCTPLVGVARDGQSAHLAVLDEYHEAKDDSLYLSLSQSMGARTQPLMLVCTTAGYTLEGPCHSFQRDCEQVLEDTLYRPELFSYIATVDKDVDWTSDTALQMANPNLGISVNHEALKVEQRNATKTASKQNPFKTKKLNVWVSSNQAFFNMIDWQALGDANLKPDMFIGKPCLMAADLSSKLDLTVVTLLFKDGNTFYCFPKLYLPEERAQDATLGMYASWVKQGALIPTPDNVIDLDTILDATVDDIEKYKPQAFIFDRWHADLYTNGIGKRCPTLTLIDLPLEVKFISPAMLELEALIAAKRIKHNNNPVANWCMSNVVAHYDAKNNVYPRNTKNEHKIDFAVSLIMAVSRTTVQTEEQQSFTPFFM